ncbi:hypothetical protein BD309DRAFT_862642 [Dichomitus squalens]|uniref:Uncharacterized protein n=1 Tax=Dichomitus squalens TaxID=114155 RepID=A0A4Q9PY36_9APHY|nr:hypothetical protein BD309DRAFT_862642 [Dichomitus squalens]TBU59214.1 hypothetical protein BD310DRAFT_817804 [Dichomitus squalens]
MSSTISSRPASRSFSPARTTRPRIANRSLSSTRAVREEASPNWGSVPPAKKRIGAFRGGCGGYRIVGFLFGFSLASSLAAYDLLAEYKLASAALQASVEDLHTSTQKVCPDISAP